MAVNWWGVAVLPLVVGCVIVGGLWYRRRGAPGSALVVRLTVAALTLVVGYVLLVLPWYTSRDPFVQVSGPLSDWAAYALLLYFGFVVGLGARRDGLLLAVGYLVVIASIFVTTGLEATRMLAATLGVLGLGILFEKTLL